MTPPPTCGFVYVATGAGYLEEARRSAVSLRVHNPAVPICLVTDRAEAQSSYFDDIVVCTDAEHKPIDKLLCARCPYERFVFLDTDTRVYGDLTPIFQVLDQFDLAAHQDVSRGWDYTLPGVPDAFSEFNTGVLAFKRNDGVEAFLTQWRRDHDRFSQSMGFVNDQPAFRHALFHSQLRVAPLPSEFHLIGNLPNYLMWKVRLIHGRGDSDSMQRDLDAVLGPRAYVPEVGVIPCFHGRRSWSAITVRTVVRMTRLLIRRPPDNNQLHPTKWWSLERRASEEDPRR